MSNPFHKSGRDFGSLPELDEIIVESTSQTTVQDKKKRGRLIFWGIIFAIILAVLGWVGSKLLDKPSEVIVEDESTTQSSQSSEMPESSVEADPIPVINNPIVKAADKLEEPSDGMLKMRAEKNEIRSGDYVLVLEEDLELTPSVVDCDLYSGNDYCLVATVKIKGKELEFYGLRDAAHSRMFDKATGFSEVEVEGSPIAATVKMGDYEDSVLSLVIINPDSSGYMITYPYGFDVDSFAGKLKIE